MIGGGEAAGVATTEPEDEGQMRSAASALCVYVCECVYVCACVSVCMQICYMFTSVSAHVFECPANVCGWLFWHM